jgi:glycosyltransferase involved in cell wall biosynthesis
MSSWMDQGSAERIEKSARQSIDSGVAALAASDRKLAIRHFERAFRLAPHDPAAALMLASALASVDPQRGETVLEASVSRHPKHRETQAALIASALRLGDPHRAAARLGALLSHAAPLQGDEFARLASHVTHDAGLPGWIGLAADGMLRVTGRQVRVLIDGKPIRLPRAQDGFCTVPLPGDWRQARHISASSANTPLAGSPVDVGSVLKVEGAICSISDKVAGWAWHPNDPQTPVQLGVVACGSSTRLACIVADRPEPRAPDVDGMQHDCGFLAELACLPASQSSLQLLGPAGLPLPGGPICLAGERESARAAAEGLAGGDSAAASRADVWRPLPILPALPTRTVPAEAGNAGFVVVLILQDGDDAVSDCLDGIALRDLIAVHGEPAEQPWQDRIIAGGGVCLSLPGLSGSALLSAGVAHAIEAAGAPRHLLLLTSACVLPPGLPGRLAKAFRDGFGMVQPMCHGVPPAFANADAKAAARRIDRLYRRCNPGRIEPLAVPDGSCLAVSHACLRETGPFRAQAFAGIAAAVADFALRARHLGWRAGLACDVFLPVAAASPSPTAQSLRARDGEALARLHPGIERLLSDQQRVDPAADARRRVAAADWARSRTRKPPVILVTHDAGGGVERHVRARAAAIRAAGSRPIVVRQATDWRGEACWLVSDGPDDTHPDLRFAAPHEFDGLVALLRADRPSVVELHHTFSHDQAICGLAPALGIPYDVAVHDFAMICPRVTCIGGTRHYCGEPADVTECDECIADHGVRIGRPEPVASLRARSAALSQGARRIVLPSVDAAHRIRRYMPGAAPKLSVQGWEDDAALAAAVPRQPPRLAEKAAPVTVCVAGAIGQDKGYDVLLACARDAARRRLNLTFTLVGHTMDDERLIGTGRIFITGPYEEHEAVALVRAQRADIGFLPSVWPETWCYALSALWQAGLWTVAFDLGAPAERIAATGAGRTVPLGMPASRLNDLFLGLPAAAGRSDNRAQAMSHPVSTAAVTHG